MAMCSPWLLANSYLSFKIPMPQKGFFTSTLTPSQVITDSLFYASLSSRHTFCEVPFHCVVLNCLFVCLTGLWFLKNPDALLCFQCPDSTHQWLAYRKWRINACWIELQHRYRSVASLCKSTILVRIHGTGIKQEFGSRKQRWVMG